MWAAGGGVVRRARGRKVESQSEREEERLKAAERARTKPSSGGGRQETIAADAEVVGSTAHTGAISA